jgi:Icc protein
MTQDPVYFVHISDTHIGPTADYALNGHQALPAAQRIVEIINALPQRPDFVIHTGDIVTDPSPEAYRLAAETFAQLDVPIYYVCGNHDTERDIRHYFEMGPHDDAADDPAYLSYTFDVRGFHFLVIDARGPAEIDPQGRLTDSQLELLAREATVEGPPLVLFIHYPVHPLNSIWMDQNMLIQNGQLLHQTLLPARRRLRGVFYGHVHQHMQTMKDGILYSSVASAVSQFGAWPNDLTTYYDNEHRPGYAFVHLLPDRTLVHQHTFVRPEMA